MNDIVYRGRRVQPRVFRLPNGGFGSKVLIWPEGGTGGWTRMGMFPATWHTGADAERYALEMAQRIVDAESGVTKTEDADA